MAANPWRSTTSTRPGLSVPLLAVALMALAAGCSGAGRVGVRNAAPPNPLRVSEADPSGKIDPALEALLARGAEIEPVAAVVDLAVQLDLDRLGRTLRAKGISKRARRDAVIAALESVAQSEQARIRPQIDALVDSGALHYTRSVAIVNRIIVEGTVEGIRRLAALPQVARVRAEWTSQVSPSRQEATPTPEGLPLPDRFRSWAVTSTGAERLWERGWTGRGVVVATIDTGAFGEHEQLAGRLQSEDRGWFDPVEGSARPRDPHGHGTSVLSVAVGGNPSGRTVGMAPGATWACAAGNHLNFYSRIRMTLAADWVLRTARPDVLVNAWSHDEEPCTDFDLPFIRAWQAAEIFVVFPAGNAGPAAETGESPAWLSGAFPDGRAVFSVAGMSRSGSVHDSSSRGPSRCGSDRFPGVAAPGAELPTAIPPDPRGYASGHGTSFSAGLVGGAAALLLEAVPEASPKDIEDALLATARDIPPPGPDVEAGAGLVDLPAALAWLQRKFVR